MNSCVIIGIGHLLFSDDGVGVHIVHAMARQGAPPGIDLHDGGTGGMALVHTLARYEHAVIVDCARMQMPAGRIRVFRYEEARTRKIQPAAGLAHGADIYTVCGLAREWSGRPRTLQFAGIQPASLAAGKTLSPPLRKRLSEYTATVRGCFLTAENLDA